MKKIKALVVDDSAYNRTVIGEMLASDAGIEVVGSATDGVDAIAKTLRLMPDVITLDLEMPNMDGFTFLRWLMKERPTPVLVLSSLSDSRSVFRALEARGRRFSGQARGPHFEEHRGRQGQAGVQGPFGVEPRDEEGQVHDRSSCPGACSAAGEERGRDAAGAGPVEVVAIASSTGGPPAIQAILSALPADLNAGIVISQHMPAGFHPKLLRAAEQALAAHGERGRGRRPGESGDGAHCAGRASPHC